MLLQQEELKSEEEEGGRRLREEDEERPRWHQIHLQIVLLCSRTLFHPNTHFCLSRTLGKRVLVSEEGGGRSEEPDGMAEEQLRLRWV